MKLDFEYGAGVMGAQLPDGTDVFIPGLTVPDPPCIPEGEIEEATRRSVRSPVGMPPLTELARRGSTVTIVLPDIVKGGRQPTAHRRVATKVILEELYAAGVEKMRRIFFSSSPTACIPGPVLRRCAKSWGRSCSTSSTPPIRSSATTVRMMNIWWTWDARRGATASS